MAKKEKELKEQTSTQNEPVETKTPSKELPYTAGTGRRKTAVARVFLFESKGEFTVNNKAINEYFPSEKESLKWIRPFHLIGVSHPTAQYSATIKVKGSSKSSQLNAVVHGISRALATKNVEYRKILRKQGLLTRDPRMVERKKPFLRKARKSPQYSKR